MKNNTTSKVKTNTKPSIFNKSLKFIFIVYNTLLF